MALFQKNVLARYIAAMDTQQIDAAYQQFVAYFHDTERQQNILTSKEEQFQEGFLRELFVNILGYTLNPDPAYNLITEKKDVNDSKKADGAILLNDEVIGVIELKDHKTPDLSKVEHQAFGYKNQHPKAKYVIICNFQKLRFYIDNAVEHAEWNLFTLTREAFGELWLCLQYNNLSRHLPATVKNESLSREEQITNKLYKDYIAFKRVLFEDILRRNTTDEGERSTAEWKILLFKKTQKLLDRLLFIFFAEDRDLLPPNSMREIIKQWRQLVEELDEDIRLYSRIKKYFGYMNEGHKGKKYDIFAYNGGLFKPDEVLDNLDIDDNLLAEHTLRLSEYDFASEVDVNILGHIFENSLSEIEEVTAQLQNGEAPTVSKRKKDGVFYTPQYITRYIVDNTLGKLCREKREAMGLVEEEYYDAQTRQLKTKQRMMDQLNEYRNWLLSLTICDPACGSGAFLNAALQFLIDEHKSLDKMEAALTGSAIEFQNVENSILENNLYGVDINEESVEIARLALWLRTAKPFRKLTTLNGNIKCGNSLISDPAIAGDKAFDWQKEFPQVFEKGGFDVVIGNPPYVNVENIPVTDKTYYKNAYKSFFKRSDLFSLFVEKGLTQLSNNGMVSFIIPSIVLNNLSYQPLRDLFLDNHWLSEVSYIGGSVFSDATVDTSILVFDKRGNDSIVLRHAVNFENPTIHSVDADYFSTFKNAISIGEENAGSITDKMFLTDFETINKHFSVYQGIVTGNNDAFIFESEEEAISKGIDKDLLHPMCHGRDIGKWEVRNRERRILYTDKNCNLTHYYQTEVWLTAFKETLQTRRECIKGVIPWYSLQWPRIQEELDIKEKVLIQNTRNESLKTRIVATIDRTGVYGTQGLNFIIPRSNEYSLSFILSVLNSKLMNYLFSTKFLNLAIKAEYLKQVRFPALSVDDQQPFIALADRMLALNKDLQEKRARFLRRVMENLGVKITGALETFDTLSFKDFCKELSKQKCKLSLSQQDEWEEYFSQYATECQNLTQTIQTTDTEIDELVYDLYGLTEEEKEIIRKS